METKELSMIEQLAQLRITAKSEIAPHEFLFDWNGVPCFAKGELVAVSPLSRVVYTLCNRDRPTKRLCNPVNRGIRFRRTQRKKSG